MKNINSFILVALVSCALFSVPVVYAAPPDVYVVYMAKDKKLGKEVVKAISNTFSESKRVKGYNATILLVSDYSGKQKTVARLSKAKLVVFIEGKRSPDDILDSKDFDNLLHVKSASDENLAAVKEQYPDVE